MPDSDSTSDEGNSSRSGARIPVAGETRGVIRAMKRGGESYDQLLRKMAHQYEPGEAGPPRPAGNACADCGDPVSFWERSVTVPRGGDEYDYYHADCRGDPEMGRDRVNDFYDDETGEGAE